MKIIIVDDNATFRKGLKFFLTTEFNYEIIAEVSNGEEFLELQNIENADIILMDLLMPKKNGIEATIEACEKYENIKIIGITNQLEKENITRMLNSGFKACISKENVFEEILEVIETVIKNENYHK
jgi:DNA-binding NarL/FixJ family response regulator